MAADLHEDVIARQVAVHIVDAFEPVDVEHEHGKRMAVARRPRELCLERLDGVGSIEAAGESIANTSIARFDENLHVADRYRGQRSRGLDYAPFAGREPRQVANQDGADRRSA